MSDTNDTPEQPQRLNQGKVATAQSISDSAVQQPHGYAQFQASMSRKDGWMNLLTGFGVQGLDKRKDTKFQGNEVLSETQLRELYQGDGIVRRIVDLPAREMMRRGFTLKGDKDNKVRGIFQERGIHKKVTDMIRWARLFGGSVGVLGLEDGGKLDQPVNEGAIRRLAFVHVFDRYRATWTSTDLYSDPNNEKFGQPQFYNISPVNGTQFRVHESRVIKLDGLPVPDLGRAQNQGWGDNVVQSCFEQIRALGSVYGAAEAVMEDFVQPVLGIKNLGEMIATGREAEIRTRLDLMDVTRHVLNTLLIDADLETYTKVASSVAGLPDLIDRFSQWLSAVSAMPQTLLMGRSAAGMNATGEGDQTNFYDDIRSEQEDKLSPIYETLCRYAFLSKEVGGQEPEDWSIEWNPLWEPTEAEVATKRKAEAEEMDIYVQMGALDPNEVRESEAFKERFPLVQGELAPPVDQNAPDPFAPPEGTPDAASQKRGKDKR